MRLPIPPPRPRLLIVLLAAGCATTPAPQERPSGPNPSDPVWQSLLRDAATQVRRCYRGPPRTGATGRQIVTRVRIFVSPQGAIQGRPMVVAQEGVTPLNRLYADRMAEAAIQSVLRCGPFRLPDGFASDSPFEIDLTFSPLAAA